MADTRYELVDELKKLPQTPQMIQMIKEAKAGEFHDYKNTTYACGKVEAHGRLLHMGHKDLAQRIANGEFDEKPDAEDDKMMMGMINDMVRGK